MLRAFPEKSVTPVQSSPMTPAATRIFFDGEFPSFRRRCPCSSVNREDPANVQHGPFELAENFVAMQVSNRVSSRLSPQVLSQGGTLGELRQP